MYELFNGVNEKMIFFVQEMIFVNWRKRSSRIILFIAL